MTPQPRNSTGTFVPTEDTLTRDSAAFDMRAEGCTYTTIALALGYSDKTAVHKALENHQKRLVSPSVEHYRAVMMAQLEHLYDQVSRVMATTHYKVADGRVVYFSETVDDLGDPIDPTPLIDDSPIFSGTDRLLKIHERLAKLMGLDAPQKVNTEITNVTVTVKGSEDV